MRTFAAGVAAVVETAEGLLSRFLALVGVRFGRRVVFQGPVVEEFGTR